MNLNLRKDQELTASEEFYGAVFHQASKNVSRRMLAETHKKLQSDCASQFSFVGMISKRAPIPNYVSAAAVTASPMESYLRKDATYSILANLEQARAQLRAEAGMKHPTDLVMRADIFAAMTAELQGPPTWRSSNPFIYGGMRVHVARTAKEMYRMVHHLTRHALWEYVTRGTLITRVGLVSLEGDRTADRIREFLSIFAIQKRAEYIGLEANK